METYFDSIATYPYTYPGGLTLDICPDILLQPIIDPVVLILAPCTLDTKGGPLANKDMKVAFSKGVYVAGNAGGNAFTASGYFGAGGTLGPALFEGWIAGKKAAYNNYESNEDNNFGKNLEVVSFMNNAYPDKTIALNFADPISFGFVNKDAPDNFRIAFKFSDSINDNIPKDSISTAGWTLFTPTILNIDGDFIFSKIVLPLNTFANSGIYLVSFQMVKQNGKSLGPKYAAQNQISVIQFNNIYNYTYLGNILPAGSLLLVQNGGSWTGKFKSLTTSGFPEAINGKNIYIQYHQPSHNFNLAYAFQFDTLADVILFSNFVFSDSVFSDSVFSSNFHLR